MALKQYREAARTAIIIAREEQRSGKPGFSDRTAYVMLWPHSAAGTIVNIDYAIKPYSFGKCEAFNYIHSFLSLK